MVRDITPAFFFFLSLAGGIFLLKFLLPLDIYFYLFWGLAIVSSAFGIVLYSASLFLSGDNFEGFKFSSLCLFFFSLGLVISFSHVLSFSNYREGRFWGVDEGLITGFRGYLSSDSRYVERYNYSFFPLRVISVSSDAIGYTGEAKNEVGVYVMGKYAFYRGEIVDILLKGKGLYIDSTDIRGVQYRVYVDGSCIQTEGFRGGLDWIRYVIFSRIDKRIGGIGYPASELFRALFLGCRDGLTGGVLDSFYESGTIHVLALSGLHVGIIFGFVYFLLFPVGFPVLRFVVSVCLIGFYIFLIGFSPSLVRAAIMLSLLGFSKFVDREINPINIISLAGGIILIFSPLSLFSLSFQLSFLSVLGIVTVGRLIIHFLKGKVHNFLLIPVAAGFGAQLAVSPILIMKFGVVYPVGIIASIFIVPLISVFLWVGIGIIFLPVNWGAFINVVRSVMDFLYLVITKINKFFSLLPGAKIEYRRTLWSILMVLLLLVFWFFPFREREETYEL